jgi:hypothetical protein
MINKTCIVFVATTCSEVKSPTCYYYDLVPDWPYLAERKFVANELVVCNGVNLEFQFTGKYDENRSNKNILRVRGILRYVMIVLSRYNHRHTEKNRVQVVRLPVIWALVKQH